MLAVLVLDCAGSAKVVVLGHGMKGYPGKDTPSTSDYITPFSMSWNMYIGHLLAGMWNHESFTLA